MAGVTSQNSCSTATGNPDGILTAKWKLYGATNDAAIEGRPERMLSFSRAEYKFEIAGYASHSPEPYISQNLVHSLPHLSRVAGCRPQKTAGLDLQWKGFTREPTGGLFYSADTEE